MPEPEIEGYVWDRNVNPKRQLGQNFKSKDKYYTDDEIAEYFSKKWDVPIDQLLITDATLLKDGRAIYRKL